jgi:glycosyltransferase involved in cell wall biosynthesis
MKILTLTNMFPTSKQPYYGIFVQEQLDEIRSILSTGTVDCLFINGNNMFSKYLLSVYALYKKLRQCKPDILHVHFGLTMLPVILLYPLLKYQNCKIALTVHGGDVVGHNRPVLWITRLGMYLSDVVICVSEEITEKVKQYTEHYLYLPCGISKEFKSAECDRKKIVVFPSSPSRHEKNYDLFCTIIAKVEVRYQEEFKVELLENLSREEVANLLQRSACMLMTSDYEGSPQAVKEAILCGLPVVSTPAGDVPLLLERYDECVVSTNEDELAEAVCHFLNHYQDVFSYDQKHKESLSNSVVCQQVVNCYKKLIG